MEGSRLYVGNLNYSVSEEMLREAFSAHGEIKNCTVIEGKGFGFVEFETAEQAAAAMEALNGQDFSGRTLRVDEARPRPERPRRNFRGEGGGGGGRGRY